jgi:lipoprotein-anchoring transpeptidase ErfK/SrfK
LCALAASVTAVALLGGIGVMPKDGAGAASALARLQRAAAPAQPEVATATAPAQSKPAPAGPRVLPADSGKGRRVVFAIGAQRVWLVGAGGRVDSTYPVSGSVTDNLKPGRYRVYSRSRWAVGVDDSGTMQYFVRFAHGPHAAIGFHTIPTLRGRPLQTRAQLGTPQSHGCIRQARTDAIRLWGFAPIGTTVVVTA